MARARVSIIVTVYNKQRYIAETLRSALRQTHGDLELIVVDDGSTDDSVQIIQRTAADDPRLRLITQENAGRAGARNRGYREASSEFVNFLDGDDLLYPTFLAETIDYLERHPEEDLVHVSWDRVDEHGEQTAASHAPDPADYLRELCLGNLFATHCLLTRKSLLDRVGPQLDIKTEDWEYWARCAKKGGRFGRLDRVLVAIRDVPDSQRKLPREQPRRFFEAIAAIFDGTMPPQYERLKELSTIRHRLFLMADYLDWGLRPAAKEQFETALELIRRPGALRPEDLPHLRCFLPRMTVGQTARFTRALAAGGIANARARTWLWRAYDGKLGRFAGRPIKRGLRAVYTASPRPFARATARLERALSDGNPPPALRQDTSIANIRRQSLDYLARMRLTRGGKLRGYRHSSRTRKPVLYATVAALLLKHLYGVRDEQTELELELLRRFQSADGLFRDPVIDCPAAEREDWWGWRHLTLHALMALALYDTPADKEVRYLFRRFPDKDAFRTYLDLRDWGARAAWTSNEVQNFGAMLQYARDRQNSSAAGEWMEALYEVVDTKQNPDTGLYGERFDSPEELSLGVQAGYHFWLLHFYDGRPVRHLERIVDHLLRTQNVLGGYGVPWHSSACEDIDSIDPLVRIARLTDYRRDDIQASLRRAVPAILGNLNADGGWVFRRHEALTVGHRQMYSAADESNVFYTWFRTLGLAYALSGLPDVSPELRYAWNFARAPGAQFPSETMSGGGSCSAH